MAVGYGWDAASSNLNINQYYTNLENIVSHPSVACLLILYLMPFISSVSKAHVT
jgi:hypothetical protein